MEKSQAMIVVPREKNIDWDEVMSVIIQALDSFGYVRIAKKLDSEISDDLEPLKLANLRSQFLGGFYDKCTETLCRINGLMQKDVSGAMKFILAMWWVERLELQDRGFDVSNLLGSTYASRLSGSDHIKMEELVTNIPRSLGNLNDFCVSLELRKHMVKQLELVLPSEVPSVNKKMLKLIKYGIYAQIYSCLSHNAEDVSSLYCDRSCSKYQLPTKTIQILTDHHKEVRCVKFSHNGLYLASGSRDLTAIIWEVQAGCLLTTKHVLSGHRRAISCVSWSPNDELLLTCARREHIKMWDVCTGECKRVIREDDHVLRSCDFFMSDQIENVYGTLMRNGSIRLLRNESVSELVLYQRPEQGRLKLDLAVTPDGRKLICYNSADGEGNVTVRSINTDVCQSFREGVRIRGISASEDSKSLIVNLINHEIHVWDLNRLDDRPLTYWNFEQTIKGNFPCIGGVGSRFLVSGTQDSKVCIWNRWQARPIAVLSGHKAAVRCVSWNPRKPRMLASAGDDAYIRIWGPQNQEVPQNQGVHQGME